MKKPKGEVSPYDILTMLVTWLTRIKARSKENVDRSSENRQAAFVCGDLLAYIQQNWQVSLEQITENQWFAEKLLVSLKIEAQRALSRVGTQIEWQACQIMISYERDPLIADNIPVGVHGQGAKLEYVWNGSPDLARLNLAIRRCRYSLDKRGYDYRTLAANTHSPWRNTTLDAWKILLTGLLPDQFEDLFENVG